MFGDIFSAASSLIGGWLDRDAKRDAFDKNAELQREFAQHGIRWRVEDAKAAGLHPLAAVGMQPASASPIFMEGGGMGDAFARAGSDIGRAISAKQTSSERLSERLLEAQIKGQEIENAYKASRLGRMVDPTQNPPPMPSASGEELVPSRVTISRPSDISTEAGRLAPAVKEFINKDGSVSIWPSADAKQSIEDSLYEYEHMYRNRILPSLDSVGDFLFENVVSPYRSLRRAAERRRKLRY